MSFSEYSNYSVFELEKIFNIKVKNNVTLFKNFKLNTTSYDFLQNIIDNISARLSLSKSANEATRSHLLVSPILLQSGQIYNLGVFFEPSVFIKEEDTPNLPHQLSGRYDGGLSLNNIDFIYPVLSVVEVKKSNISDGLGQCLAEMYATLLQFKQNKVYGIITDGDLWKFLLLKDSTLSVDKKNYHIGNVNNIVDRIGFIAKKF